MKKIKKFILKKLGILSILNRLKALEKENVKLKDRLKESDKKVAGLKKQCAASEKQHAESNKRYAELQQQYTVSEKKYAESEKQLAELKKQYAESEKQHAALEKQYEELKKHIKSKDAFYNRLHAEKKKQISNLERYIFSQNRGLNEVERKQRIIVSVTSYPARIESVPIVLERMLVQTIRPDKIVLWLSKEQFPDREAQLPETLLALVKDGVEIGWCDGDVKSYKKILPALREYPDDLIITIDDDLIYRVDFIENLYRAHQKFPNAIIASRVHQITFDETGRIAPYKQWVFESDHDVNQIRNDWFFTTGAGTLFPPHIFDEEVFRTDIIKEICPTADDIWMNINAARNHVPIVNTANNNHLTYVEGTQDDSLWIVNREQNDVQLKQVIDHYKEQLTDSIYRHI